MDLRVIMVGKCGLDLCGLEYGPMMDSSEHGNVPSGSVKVYEFFYPTKRIVSI
jgi:hypothetical protein